MNTRWKISVKPENSGATRNFSLFFGSFKKNLVVVKIYPLLSHQSPLGDGVQCYGCKVIRRHGSGDAPVAGAKPKKRIRIFFLSSSEHLLFVFSKNHRNKERKRGLIPLIEIGLVLLVNRIVQIRSEIRFMDISPEPDFKKFLPIPATPALIIRDLSTFAL